MQRLLEPVVQSKIRSLEELKELLQEKKAQGLKIVQCHGVFDLLHPGHIRHFKVAKEQGDLLVVSVTPDLFVNKGPGRPAFPQNLRLESLAALEVIDYVVLNTTPDAISAIRIIQPAVFVKGIEYQDHAKDVTGKIAEEVKAVEFFGGRVFYTDDLVFSSSSLLNRYFEQTSPEVRAFLEQFKKRYTAEEVIEKIEALRDLKITVIGDAILDEYQYVSPLGQSGKGLHMTARCLDKELFIGGSLIIANHLAQFVKEVSLITAIGKDCPHREFIMDKLEPNIRLHPVDLDGSTLVKKRYVLKDGNSLFKLFETYSGAVSALAYPETQTVLEILREADAKTDALFVADFGNGFTNPLIVNAISDTKSFLVLNTQTNSGNRGFNVVTNYRRADYISLNEPELRLSAHDRDSSLESIVQDTKRLMHCSHISVTRGVEGVLCFSEKEPSVTIPAFSAHSVDRIGAGDSYLSLSGLCRVKGYSPLLAGFIGSIAAALSVQMFGNQEPIRKVPLCKFITRLLK